MALYRRGGTWWIDFTTSGGERVRRSARTQDKKAAKELHDQLKAKAWRAAKLGEKPSRIWDEAALKFLKESESKASFEDYKRQIAFWTERFRGRQLDRIDRHSAAEIVEKHFDTPATRNRYIACLRAVVMKAAGEWEWIGHAPKFKTYAEPKIRVRWLTHQEAERLIHCLAEWIRPMASFALATGIRQSNLLHLGWNQVDLERKVGWIHADQAKARRAIGIPLNDDALSVLNSQLGRHPERVFVGLDGTPLTEWSWEARRAWAAGCREAGIEVFRWHDLRHTWASWHIQRGTPLLTLKELGGWSTLEMVQRYAHLAPEHLAAYANNAKLQPTVQTRHIKMPRLLYKVA